MKRQRQIPAKEAGFSLIEVLVVLTVLGLAMMPLASTQFNSRRAITQADRQSQAMQVAIEQIERARMSGFGAAVADSVTIGEYEVLTQLVPDGANPFLEEVRVTVQWTAEGGPKSLFIAGKRAAR